ncbi:tripartite tricarboxylate transporter substrate binding protein [Variovorax sp. J22P271]|uniref:Bug family tripartite tricarboxylate transporter substrate binding protein n=1 Tax=Variovorax davisae TaxID=3053515 RepID=UPI0025751A08|nr:tripartite tricarboxylate transporter substrate binding protein [Variovorax sp. J22P271]MDM0036865.1 tripartite tricarboxylate transporter substrate binding protein [Variovorax sp. J22P271]
MNRRKLLATTLTLAALGTALDLHAGDYPSKPITLIAPSGPGGGYDLTGRMLADVLGRQMGASFIVENRAGSGTLIGTQAAAVAAPDGHTLLVGGLSNLVFNAALYKKLPYNPRDFVPIGLVARYPYLLVARGDLPQNDLKELLAELRANPDRLTIATSGPGSGQEVMATLFAKSTGTKITQVPYKAAAPAYQDLLAGRVDLFLDTLTTARPHVDAKRLKAIFLTSEKRSPHLPAVPTAAELGLPQLQMGTWFGLFAQRGVPPPVIEQLRAALRAAVQSGELARRLEPLGIEVMNLDQAATEAFINAEHARWTQTIKQSGTTLD